MPDPRGITSVGWLIEAYPTHLVLASTESGHDGYLNPLAIPRGCITQMEVL